MSDAERIADLEQQLSATRLKLDRATSALEVREYIVHGALPESLVMLSKLDAEGRVAALMGGIAGWKAHNREALAAIQP